MTTTPQISMTDSQGNDWTAVFAAYTTPNPKGIQDDILYVEYGEGHSADFIDAELSGDWSQVDTVSEHEEHWEVEADAVHDLLVQELRNHDIDPHTALDEDRDLYDRLREAVENSPNVIHPSETLRENTPPQLLRLELFDGEELQEHDESTYHDADAKMSELERRFRQLGLDPTSKVNAEAIEDMVLNGPEYWHEAVSLDVIWYGTYSTVIPGSAEQTVAFTNPNLVLIDSMNGSGFDAEVEGTITRTLGIRSETALDSKHRAYLDSKAGQYGWAEIAGVHKPAYDTHVEVQDNDN